MRKSALLCSVLAAAAGLSGGIANAQPVSVTLVAIEGQDIGDGLTFTAFGDPYVNSLGQVGFLYTRSDSTTARGMWINNASVFHSDQLLPDIASGGESTIGISDAGDFIYSPSLSGGDSVVTSHGKLLNETDPAPGMPGLFSRFNSRPRMAANGTAFWVGGYTNVQGGTTQGYVFWKCTDTSDPSTITPGLRTGDLIDGRAIGSSGVVFNFAVSDDATQVLNSIDLDGSTADDTLMLLNGTTIVAREGQPTGDGDLWSNFDDPAINNSGNYVFTGDTNGATATDGFIAYNGQIVLREGAVVDGVPLVGNAADIAIDNTNRVLFTWNSQSSTNRTRTVFLGTAPDLASSTAILRLDQEVDTTGDGVADYTVFGINIGAGPGLTLSENGPVYLSVQLVPIGGGGDLEAIIAIGGGGEPECPADWNEDTTVNSGDISAFLTAWLASVQFGNLNADFNGDSAVNSGDISAFLTAWLDAVQNGC